MLQFILFAVTSKRAIKRNANEGFITMSTVKQ